MRIEFEPIPPLAIVVTVTIVVLSIVAFAIYATLIEHKTLRDKCTETSLFVIGDKGGVNMVYDCSGIPHE